ncbi:hypothetical protein [Kitasatospora sp. NPDC059571]|uniref:hypothetical protein n=1 Tax=Kitasatospora sp. NPDC059571 TaxID=3346871 RepID=UPI00368BEA7F
MSTGTLPDQSVGIRSADDIRDALRLLSCPSGKPRRKGAQAAYRWALKPSATPPVGMDPAPADPTLRVMAQERLALALARDPGLDRQHRRYARGVAQALGWVLGYSPDRP